MTRDELMDPNQIVQWLPQMLANVLVSTRVLSTSSAIKTMSATVGTTSAIIIQANPDRKAFMLYNNSANSGYFTFGTVSNGSSCSFILATFANWQWSLPNIVYTGPISCIRNAGTGTVTITEFV